MIEMRPFFKEDILEIKETSPKSEFLGYISSEENLKILDNCRYAQTVYDAKTEEVLMCGGIVESWPGRGVGWAVFNHEKASRHFIVIDRMVRRFLKTCEVKRIEAQIQYDFERGHRWAESLGFKLEASRMVGFFPTGEDGSLYARIK